VKQWIFLAIKIIIAIAIVRYLVSGIDWKAFEAGLRSYSPAMIAAGAVLIVWNDAVQAVRWSYLSRYQCSWMASVEAIIIGGFINVILPAKLGEVSRVIYLRNFYNYPINRGVGVIVLERGADLFVVALMVLLSAWLVADSQMMKDLSVLVIVVMIGAIYLLKNGNGHFIKWGASKIPVRVIRVYGLKIIRVIQRELENERIVIVVLYTIFLRGTYFLTMVFFLTQIGGFVLEWKALFIIYLVGSLAMAVPLLPGGTGTFHAGIVMAAGWYGISKESAFAIAVLYHLLLNMVPILLSLVILFSKNISVSGMVKLTTKREGESG
jgi:hypothetical protein